MTDPSAGVPLGDDLAENTHARWEIAHLAELARGGNLSAARELVRRAIAQCDQEPELYGPALSEWLKDFLDRVAQAVLKALFCRNSATMAQRCTAITARARRPTATTATR